MCGFGKWLRSPRTTGLIRFVLDECLPPIIRDRRWFYWLVVRVVSRSLDMDFKRKAPFMTDEEFVQAYEKIPMIRARDSSDAQLKFVLENLVGDTVLEVGAGSGDLSVMMARTGRQLVATDITQKSVEHLRNRSQLEGLHFESQTANLETLPFPDASFDAVVCVHTLEHVRNLAGSISELKRVARKQIILVVPRERFYRYTCNYHLQFFGGEEQLILDMGLPRYTCQVIDGALCYTSEITERRREPEN